MNEIDKNKTKFRVENKGNLATDPSTDVSNESICSDREKVWRNLRKEKKIVKVHDYFYSAKFYTQHVNSCVRFNLRSLICLFGIFPASKKVTKRLVAISNEFESHVSFSPIVPCKLISIMATLDILYLCILAVFVSPFFTHAAKFSAGEKVFGAAYISSFFEKMAKRDLFSFRCHFT